MCVLTGGLLRCHKMGTSQLRNTRRGPGPRMEGTEWTALGPECWDPSTVLASLIPGFATLRCSHFLLREVEEDQCACDTLLLGVGTRTGTPGGAWLPMHGFQMPCICRMTGNVCRLSNDREQMILSNEKNGAWDAGKPVDT